MGVATKQWRHSLKYIMENSITKTTAFNQRLSIAGGLIQFLSKNEAYLTISLGDNHPLPLILQQCLIWDAGPAPYRQKNWQALLTKFKHLDNQHYSPPVVQFSRRAICDCIIRELEFRPEYQQILSNKQQPLTQIYRTCQAWLRQHQKRDKIWKELLKLLTKF